MLGISELRWTGLGLFQCDNDKVFFSNHETCKTNGMAVRRWKGQYEDTVQSMIG